MIEGFPRLTLGAFHIQLRKSSGKGRLSERSPWINSRVKEVEIRLWKGKEREREVSSWSERSSTIFDAEQKKSGFLDLIHQ